MKLSESGRLYLADYHLLEEARGEMTAFLDSVVEELDRVLRRDLGSLGSNLVICQPWSNKSSPGFIEVSFRLAGPTSSPKDTVLAVWYSDIRHAPTIENPLAASIIVRRKSAFAATLRTTPEELQSKFIGSLKTSSEGTPTPPSGLIYWQGEVPFDVESSQASAQLVGDIIVDRCARVVDFLGEVAEHLSSKHR